MKRRTERYKEQGAAALPTILIMATVVIELAVGAVVVASMLSNTASNRKLSIEALGAARAGAQDGLLYIQRHCSDSSGCARTYDLAVGSRTTHVEIVDGGGGIVTITSTGDAKLKKKRIVVEVGIDATTTQTHIRSFKEVAL